MVEISKSGSGEGLGGAIPRGYSTASPFFAGRPAWTLSGGSGVRVGSAEGGAEASWRGGALASGVSRLVGVARQSAEVERSR